MYFDAHTHLNAPDFDTIYPDILSEAAQQNIQGVVNIGTDLERSQKAIDIAKEYEKNDIYVKATVGFHPGLISFSDIKTEKEIESKITEAKALIHQNKQYIVGIGECGIDAHYDNYSVHQKLQKVLFHKQCELAQEVDLPVIIHTRDQFEDTWEVMQDYPDIHFYVHCRGYSPDAIDLLATRKLPTRVGFCGNITYPKAENIRQSFLHLRKRYKGKIHPLLETDAPYLAPQGKRGQKNTPLNITDIYEYVCGLVNEHESAFQQHIQENRESLYHQS